LLVKKSEAVPLQAWSGPEGSRKLRFPDFMTTAQNGGKVVSLRHRPPLLQGNTPGTHFCLRLSRLQGHSATGRIMSRKNSSDTIGNRTRDLPVCSVVPLTTASPPPSIVSIETFSLDESKLSERLHVSWYELAFIQNPKVI